MEVICDSINKEVLKSAVASEHNVSAENVQVDNFSIKSGSKKGDGFACEIAAIEFQAVIEGKEYNKNYIAKYAPEGHRREMLKEMNAFEQEVKTYTWLIPRLQKLREEKSLPPIPFPKCFYASVEDSLMVLQNLKSLNFEVVEKKPEPLSLHAIKLVLKELAAFHATGLHFINTYPGGKEVLAADYPGLFTESFFVGKDMSEEMTKIFEHFQTNMFRSCVLVSKQYGSEELASKMAAFQPKIKNVLDALFEKQSKINFITHGDAWYNNFLYRYSNEAKLEPTAVTILDLQNTRLGRPGLELAYFFCSSTSPQQRKDNFEELFQFYYDQFFLELTSLGDTSKPFFSLEDLKKEYDECYTFGFIMGCMHSQIYLVHEDSNANFDMEAFGDDLATTRMIEAMEVELLSKAESSPAYRQIIMGLANEAMLRNVI